MRKEIRLADRYVGSPGYSYMEVLDLTVDGENFSLAIKARNVLMTLDCIPKNVVWPKGVSKDDIWDSEGELPIPVSVDGLTPSHWEGDELLGDEFVVVDGKEEFFSKDEINAAIQWLRAERWHKCKDFNRIKRELEEAVKSL